MRTRSPLTVVATLVAGLVLAGCGTADEPTAPDDPDEPAASDVDEPAADDDHAADDDAMAGAIGEPADASDATRTIAVEAVDIAFEPEAISVEPGEIVTFEVTNTGEAVHEFFLGDPEAEDDHAEEMAEMGDDMAHDEPNSIFVDPGETKQLTWRFPDSGTVEYACFVPGHYEAGMHGPITVG